MVDVPTLLAVTVGATATSGALLVYAWFTDRQTPALAIWAIGYLVGALGTALIVARGNINNFWSIDVANALLIAGYGLMWKGARAFEGRATPTAYVFVGSAIWLAVCQIEALHSSLSARIATVSLFMLSYTLLTGLELIRSSEKQLMSRWPLIVVIAIHAVVFFSRVLWPGRLALLLAGSVHPLSVMALVAFEILFHSFCAAFLLTSLARERIELRYKRASLTDPLTGVSNRRAFEENGSRLLQRSTISNQPIALFAFDLDRFKAINDSHGHAAGDRVLCKFCDVVAESMRPDDLFGRIGGEEFCCLLTNVSLVGAITMAERVRRRFSEMEIDVGTGRLRATVSAGVTVAGQGSRDLLVLLSAADKALYRAKESGRNRTEVAQPDLAATDRRPVSLKIN